MTMNLIRWLLFAACIASALPAHAALIFPNRWIHGAPGEPALQVHQAAPGFWILRQSKRSHFEAPFLYLLAGEKRALLLDTGAMPEDGSTLPLRSTVDRLLREWARRHPGCAELIVAHTHSHRDHLGGDGQFTLRPRTRVVGATPQAVAAQFGLVGWPEGEAAFDLGGRKLVVLPLPGHEPSHIAIYDETTRTLLTGDSLYPGMLTVRDLGAYRASAAKLARFVRRHPIDHVLGTHIEMTRTARRMYPLETRYQPEEHALALRREHVLELERAVTAAGDFRGDVVRADFLLHRVVPSSRDKPSIHGMLVVGTQALYLSHLPMFHTPHDYQVIVEATFRPGVMAQYRQDARAHPDALYTVAPTRTAVLAELIREGATFTVDLYRGHFERGGVSIAKNVDVSVQRVVHFRRFEPGASPDPTRWIGFGRRGEAFLVHRIEGAPDMDQVVQLDRPAVSHEGEEIRLERRGPLARAVRVGATRVHRILYTEFGELMR